MQQIINNGLEYAKWAGRLSACVELLLEDNVTLGTKERCYKTYSEYREWLAVCNKSFDHDADDDATMDDESGGPCSLELDEMDSEPHFDTREEDRGER